MSAQEPALHEIVFSEGARKARAVAAQTMTIVRERLGVGRIPGNPG
jgi:hypothetical protein